MVLLCLALNPLAALAAPVYQPVTGFSNPFDIVDVGYDAAPTLGDIDGDGDLDAFVGEGFGEIYFYRNTGSPASPSYVRVDDDDNPFYGVNFGYLAAPTLVDIDNDGDLDAFIGALLDPGTQEGAVFFFRNTGNASAPVFEEVSAEFDPFNGVISGTMNKLTFGDLDGDNDLDALIGDADGLIHYFANTGSATAPYFYPAAGPLNGVDVGALASPALADMDGDGDLDALVGEEDGVLNYFRNDGTPSAPNFVELTGANNPFNGVDLGALSDPTLADIDNDGDLDALVGEADGGVFFFRSVQPEIDVRGSGVSIVDGETTPSSADGSDFGGIQMTTGQVTRTFTIHNTGGGPLTLGGTPVTLSGAHAADFSVTSQPAATVSAGSSTTFQVRFTPSALGARNATLSIASDDADENPYTFAVTGTGTNTLIQFSQDSYQVQENGTPSGSTISLTITRTGDTSAASQVQVNLTNGEAIGGSDFTSTPITVTFPAGSSASQTVSVPVTQDTVDEPDETLTLTLTALSNAQIGSQSSATLTILDDDLPPAPEIDVRGSSVSIADGDTSPNTSDGTDFGSALVAGGQVTRTFTIHNTGGASLTLGGTPVTVSGTHAADFAVVSQPVSPVAAGASTTFQVRFDPSALDARTATVSIASNDANENPYTFAITGMGVTPTIVFSQDSYQVNEDGTPSGTAITLTRSDDTSAASQVQVGFTNGSAIGGADFTSTPITITFPAGSSASQTVNVPITQDTIDEPNEDLTLTLTALSNAQIGAQSTATLTILDDDLPPAPEIDVRGSSVSIADGDTSPNTSDGTDFGSALVAGGQVTRTFAIHNTGGASLTLGATPVTVSGAHAADFAVVSQPVSPVAAGASTTFQVRFDPSALDARTATVSIASNDANENPYTFTVIGTGVTPTIVFSQPAYQVNEDGTPSGPAVTLTRSGDTSAASQVQVSFTNGSASGGSDFTATPITVTFPAGSSASQTVTVPILQDTTDEPNEDLTLTLAALSNAQIGAQSTATLTILDDDGAGYAINPLVFQVGEGETQVVSIALTSQPTASVTIHLGSSAPAQCTVTPASVVLTPATWQSGVTFSVSGVEDGLADGEQSCTILTTVSTTDPAYSALNPADLSVTISDQRHIYLPLVTR